MKKIIISLTVIAAVAACQKNAAPASLLTQNITPSAADKISDGKEIAFVKIGTQKWMAANLDVTHYQNGDKIPEVKGKRAWENLTTGAWCWYNDDSATGAVYGRLYNWYAVNDPRGLAPEGWHIPAKAEWNKLLTYLGGESVAGGALKETGTANWHKPNTDATDTSGFTALPGGECDFGNFKYLHSEGLWWTTTPKNAGTSYCYFMNNTSGSADKFSLSIKTGLSVRCIKDKN